MFNYASMIDRPVCSDVKTTWLQVRDVLKLLKGKSFTAEEFFEKLFRKRLSAQLPNKTLGMYRVMMSCYGARPQNDKMPYFKRLFDVIDAYRQESDLVLANMLKQHMLVLKGDRYEITPLTQTVLIVRKPGTGRTRRVNAGAK